MVHASEKRRTYWKISRFTRKMAFEVWKSEMGGVKVKLYTPNFFQPSPIPPPTSINSLKVVIFTKNHQNALKNRPNFQFLKLFRFRGIFSRFIDQFC